jgi:hypothetical protein
MEESRLCIACGAQLAGPFQPKTTLTQHPPTVEMEADSLTAEAHAWICLGCGLVHWYADDESIAQILAAGADDGALPTQPDTSYERRAQMLRMLRRVRRM